jgi:CheY-like chemotaxis protein
MGGLHLVPVRTIAAARESMRQRRPAAIVLDILLDGEASWAFLSEVKADPLTRDIPVFVVTVTNREQQAKSLGAEEFWAKPLDLRALVSRLKELASVTATT